MNNFVQEGKVMDYVNSTGADLASGDVVVVGNRLGVCATNIANGDTGSVEFGGVYSLPKLAATAMVQGLEVFWDTTAKVITNVIGSGNIYAGRVWVAAQSADPKVQVSLGSGAKRAALVSTTSVGATFADLAAARTAVNQLKTDVDGLITSLRAAGLIA